MYFDNASTTKLDERVLQEMLPYLMDNFANASSIHNMGREARQAIEQSRIKIANILNCKPNEIYFTSGGSESDNTALRGIAKFVKNSPNTIAKFVKNRHIIVSQIEHPAILETCRALEKEGFAVSYIPVDNNGFIDLDALKKEIRPTTILISVMFANNEIGTIQPIKEIGKIAREHGIYFHTDAVQAIGNIEIDVQKLNIDSLSLSSHKFYGPKGIGVLYVRENVPFENLIYGGHQERGKRAGTENVASIVGMARAMELAYQNLEENNAKLKELREYFIERISKEIPRFKLNGDRNCRLPGNINVSFECIDGESLLLNLDLKGICVSSGSACSSGSLTPSHVLKAIGLSDELASGSLRVTFGKYNTKEEVDYLVENLAKIVEKLRKLSPSWDKLPHIRSPTE